ncbi:alpha/beta-hydrolase [Stipitochalara longipes BDJ]|nr:alpha/beta-hydrolase [Stipitochalara longipes BDJ]
MLSHILKAWHWVAESLFPQKVDLSVTQKHEATVIALNLLNLIKEHKFAEALQNGTSAIKLLVSPATLEKVFKDLQTSQGQVVSFAPVGVEGIGSKRVVKVLVKFEKGNLLAVVVVDDKGLIAGFRLKPAEDVPPTWTHPTYVDPSCFDDEEVTLSAAGVEVGASLSIPKSKPVAGVVFLAGSGPTDRDSTLGPNKPLKDLAWGLASNEIAVARWDKPSAESSKVSDEGITLEKEYLPYSLAAIKTLQKKLADSDIPIFILGHSLGAMVAPLAAKADSEIKGVVMLSAAGGKMYDSALRQMQYLVSLNHDPPFATQDYVELLAQQVAVIKDPDFNATSKDNLPFAAPASYWLSVKEYDQVAEVKKLSIPVYILQPGRDYQVTVEGDLVKWKEGLKDKDTVEIKVYEGLNHLFLAGEGPSTPEDYAVEEHVEEAAVMDICEWIKKSH